jgi:hypothetical protein
MGEELSPEQIEAIVNLQAITENYDQDRAIALLQVNDWDVMVASRKAAAQSFYNDADSARPASQHRREEAAPYYPPRQSLMEDDQPSDTGIIPSALSGLMRVGASVSSFFSGWFGSSAQPAPSSDTLSDWFRANYPGQVTPAFSKLSLTAVLERARLSKQPIMFYIHSTLASQRFVREVLCSELIIDILDQSFITWGTLDSTDEGRSLQRHLNSRELPLFAICRMDAGPNPVLLEIAVRATQEGEFTMEGLFTFIDCNLALFREQTRSEPSQRSVEPGLAQDRL